MQTSLNFLFRAGKLRRDAFGAEVFRPGKSLQILRALDEEMLEGRHEGGTHRRKKVIGSIPSLSTRLNWRTGPARSFASRKSVGQLFSFADDERQRVVVSIRYYSHGGGGGGALRAHARYLDRDAVARSPQAETVNLTPAIENEMPEAKARAAGRYVEREHERRAFFDALGDGVDGRERAALWSRDDRRHIRIVLAPENGTALGDLRSYTREVMSRVETAMGTRLEWVAIDHWDTDNPHTHLILRGSRSNGKDLVISREKWRGLKSAAEEVATERLGNRTPAEERFELNRKVRAHRPIWLDQWIDAQLDDTGMLRIAELRAPNGDALQTEALKRRANELKRLGVATEVRRNILQFSPDWIDDLKTIELHLNIRRAQVRSHTLDIARAQQQSRSLAPPFYPGPDL